jgi:hypothetical protein
MDTRKLVKYINESAQSSIKTIEKAIYDLGQKVGKSYELVALHKSNLMFCENSGDHSTYYMANYKKNRGRVRIDNVSQVDVVEEKKVQAFSSACMDLVESIESGDTKSAENAFNKLGYCRFRPTVASKNGVVYTRDGKRRVIRNDIVNEEVDVAQIVSTMLEEQVDIENGELKSADIGSFGALFNINESLRRRAIARHMKSIAEEAHKKSPFQKFIYGVASQISHDKVRTAIENSATFLREYQEFCLLNLTEMEDLVGNALAANNVYNPAIIENTALLLYRTNVRANRDDIIKAWRETAKTASSSVMLEDINIVAESDDFDNDYQSFLYKTLNESANPDMVVNALGAILALLQAKIDSEEADGDSDASVVNSINSALGGSSEEGATAPSANEDLINARDKVKEMFDKVSDPDTRDDATMQAAENLIANINTDAIKAAAGTIEDFDVEADAEMDAGDVMSAVDEMDGGEEAEGAEGEEDPLGGLGLEGGLEGGDLGLDEPGDLDLGMEEGGEEEGDLGMDDLDFSAPEGEEEDLPLAASQNKDGVEPITESEEYSFNFEDELTMNEESDKYSEDSDSDEDSTDDETPGFLKDIQGDDKGDDNKDSEEATGKGDKDEMGPEEADNTPSIKEGSDLEDMIGEIGEVDLGFELNESDAHSDPEKDSSRPDDAEGVADNGVTEDDADGTKGAKAATGAEDDPEEGDSHPDDSEGLESADTTETVGKGEGAKAASGAEEDPEKASHRPEGDAVEDSSVTTMESKEEQKQAKKPTFGKARIKKVRK